MKIKNRISHSFLCLLIIRILIFAAIVPLQPASGQTASPKRGLAYGNNSPADLGVLAQGLTWWYNWSETPESSVINSYSSYGFDFVPMAWGSNFNQQKLRDYLTLHPEVKYILGFNEPNFTGQANLTPSQAAANWPNIEAIADEFGLKIVGPAVNYCGACVSENGVTYTDPLKYLDDFFTDCSNCRVDYIAVHCYMNTVGALSWYVDQFKKYGRPIWLTEFAGWESNNNIKVPADQESFLIGAVDFLETDTSVFRYSWFIGRTGGGPFAYPFIDLLGADGTLTDLGQIYVSMPAHDPTLYVPVPGRIEAEKYSRMNGIMLEKTSDVSGFANVGYIDANDWLEYNLDVSQSGLYPLDFRIASTASSGLDVYVDNMLKISPDFTNTGGWQNWQTFSSSILLESGSHKLRLVARAAGFNINWLEIRGALTSTPVNTADRTVLYPNPATDLLYLENTGDATLVEITDMLGITRYHHTVTLRIDIGFLRDGYYVLRVYNPEKNNCFIRSFIKKTE
jgi:hypothetical protein